jgi:hypothetical protein
MHTRHPILAQQYVYKASADCQKIVADVPLRASYLLRLDVTFTVHLNRLLIVNCEPIEIFRKLHFSRTGP